MKSRCLCSQGCPWEREMDKKWAKSRDRQGLFLLLPDFLYLPFLIFFIFYNLIPPEFTCQKRHPSFISTPRTRLNSSSINYLPSWLLLTSR